MLLFIFLSWSYSDLDSGIHCIPIQTDSSYGHPTRLLPWLSSIHQAVTDWITREARIDKIKTRLHKCTTRMIKPIRLGAASCSSHFMRGPLPPHESTMGPFHHPMMLLIEKARIVTSSSPRAGYIWINVPMWVSLFMLGFQRFCIIGYKDNKLPEKWVTREWMCILSDDWNKPSKTLLHATNHLQWSGGHLCPVNIRLNLPTNHHTLSR